MRAHLWRTALLLVALLPASAPAQQSQNPATLEFEVASIKPVAGPDAVKVSKVRGMFIDGARVDFGAASLLQLIMTAYHLRSYQVSGPDWIRSTRFDIQAKLPEGAAEDRVPEMLQSMLAQRFKLVAHRTTRETSVYALVIGKDGLKLTPAPPASTSAGAQSGPSAFASGREVKYTKSGESVHFKSSHMTMVDLALQLTPYVDRPIVDMTNLPGAFAISMDISMDDVAAAKGSMDRSEGDSGAGLSDSAGSSVFAALQKLGLKLEHQKGPAEYLIIDQAEKIPTPN